MTSEQLFYDKKTGFDRLTDEDKQGIQTYAEGYKKFLDESKTERDAVLEIARMAESKGFRAWTRDDTLRPGDKIYRINRHKGIMLAVIGEKSLAKGVRLTAAHLDAPRVDIRTVPLYEDNGMAFFKTHYYGGIKKYQWTAIPLELRGVVCVCENGEVKRVQVRVGDKPTEVRYHRPAAAPCHRADDPQGDRGDQGRGSEHPHWLGSERNRGRKVQREDQTRHYGAS